MRESVGHRDRLLAAMAGPWSTVVEIGPDGEVIGAIREGLGVGLRGC